MLPSDARVGNQSIGDTYISLTSDLKGKTNSILSPTYSYSLKEFSATLENRISRTVKFPRIQPGMQIITVWLNGVLLKADQWTSQSASLTIADSVNLNKGDRIHVDYKIK